MQAAWLTVSCGSRDRTLPFGVGAWAVRAVGTAGRSAPPQQQKGMEAVTARLEQQSAQIQKVSAQLEASKPAPETVLNNQ